MLADVHAPATAAAVRVQPESLGRASALDHLANRPLAGVLLLPIARDELVIGYAHDFHACRPLGGFVEGQEHRSASISSSVMSAVLLHNEPGVAVMLDVRRPTGITQVGKEAQCSGRRRGFADYVRNIAREALG